MLAIRLKRIGRSNHAQYRVIVQDSHRHPKRGAVVEYIGTYDPHNKTTAVDKDRAKHYLSNGAQPSTSVARLLKAEGVKLPKWVNIDKNPKRPTRNPEKLRKNRPADAEAPAPKAKEAPVEEAEAKEAPAQKSKEEPAAEEPKAETASTEDQPVEDAKAEETKEEPKAEQPAEDKAKPDAKEDK